MIRLASLVVAGAALALAGCQTTEQRSAAIGKRLAHERAAAAVTKIGTTNASVRVEAAQLVDTASGSAAALELTNTSGQAQADIPILITVTDTDGKTIYSNATVGTSSPSGELSLLGPHATAWWVDANVLARTGVPAHLNVRIGRGVTPPPAAPALRATNLSSGSNFVGAYIGGRVLNASATAQSNATVYAVAITGTRVVGAGQSLIVALGAHASSAFQVSVLGRTAGARLQATIVPAHLR